MERCVDVLWVWSLPTFSVCSIGDCNLGLHTLQASTLPPSDVPSRFSYFDETFIQKRVVFCRNRCEVLA